MQQTLASPAETLYEALRRMRLIGGAEEPALVPLAGGVSSDIYRVDLAQGPICLKRALPKLKVSAEWTAPVERNQFEMEWMRTARAIEPDFVPRVIGHDPQSGTFAMEYLRPETHPVWKAQLRDGDIDPGVAAEVARRIVAVHAATASDPSIAQRFATDAIFHAIRLEPYLLATAARHPDRALELGRLASVTAATKLALVHGDVSPKNILVVHSWPILLDAECALHGDPAFDLAFCLNHMLLKCLWRPQWRARYLECFEALATTYCALVTWEPPEALEARTAKLLPGLFLGRVDGKSPVEYVTDESDKDRVRRVARELLLHPVERVAGIRDAWRKELER
jgi:5-methylthioribose kinase